MESVLNLTKRRTVSRLGPRLVGMPPEPEDLPGVSPPAVSVAVEEPPQPPPKRGRLKKGDDAMTPAERQRARRKRIQQEKTAPERDRLIKLIVRRVKTSEHANITMMKNALSKFRETLDVLTLGNLTDIAKQYTILHDRKGRSSLEGQTGTPLVAGEFIDRIERIYSKSETRHLYGGQKSATGASPVVDNQLDDDSGTTSSKVVMREGEVTLWDMLPQISETMFDGEEVDALWDTDDSALVHQPTLRCRACGHLVPTWLHARRHTEEALRSAEKQLAYVNDLQALADKSGDDVLLVAARIEYRDKYDAHLTLARVFMNDYRDSRKRNNKRLRAAVCN